MSEPLIFAHFLFFVSDVSEMSDVSESLISLTKNERMSESLIFLSESLIRSFFDKKWAIRSEIKWANSQPWVSVIQYLSVIVARFIFPLQEFIFLSFVITA